MAMQTQGTVVGVFHDHDRARKAIRLLRDNGFTEAQIGVASSQSEGLRTTTSSGDVGDESYAAEGAAAGVAAGAGVGALWGLGILAGVLPAIGPAIAGGTLAAILSSAAAGAAAAGLGGALIGMGLSKEEAEFYESELHSGRTIVTVNAGNRNSEARSLLQQAGAYDMQTRGTTTASASSSRLATSSTTTATASTACPTPTKSAAAAPKATSTAGNTVQARAEELHVDKSKVRTGEVQVRKEVHTEHKTIDVPVTREEVVIERRPVQGQAAPGTAGREEIRIPVSEEQVNVEKQTVVKEEVTVGKRKVQDTKHIGADLKKEEIKVETKGDVNVRDKRK